MYYFIPAWFGQEYFWEEEQVPWYFAERRIEFDDTLHQVRMFQQEDKHPKLLLLSYQPHLRYLLHRQDALEVESYSFFDQIQGLGDPAMRPLQVRDLDWDEDCDFIYTSFAMVVERHGERYAEIELGIEGFLRQVRYFKNGQIDRELLFDDRGFVSSILYFEQGKAHHRHYLNLDGDWQVCEYLSNRLVEVNPRFSRRFKETYYPSMADVIWEFIGDFLHDHLQSDDVFVLASHQQHNAELYRQLPKSNQKILTCFVERNRHDQLEVYKPWLEVTDVLISDRQDFLDRMQALYPEEAHKMHQLTSYDTRLALGRSQRVKESKIFYQVNLGQIDEDALYQILSYVAAHPETTLTFGAFNAPYDQFHHLQERVNGMIRERFLLTDFQEQSEDQSGAENRLEENLKPVYRYDFINLQDETSLIKELEYTRLIVDLSEEPNLYTQIAGVSAGIPQINAQASEYVTHLENGYIVSHFEELHKGADHFLGQLKYWNQALIDSVEKIKENTGDRLIEKWENWLREETDDSREERTASLTNQ